MIIPNAGQRHQKPNSSNSEVTTLIQQKTRYLCATMQDSDSVSNKMGAATLFQSSLIIMGAVPNGACRV